MTIYYENISDIPILFSIARRLKIDQIFDNHIPSHGNLQGLSYGLTAIGWLIFILSSANHRKSHVQSWALETKKTLSILFGKDIDPNSFNDDRLARMLRFLNDDEIWHSIENDLWRAKMNVFELPVTGIRLDGTNTFGFHGVKEDGLMQYGFSKDGRSDLPILKLMVAAEGNTGEVIAVDVVEGNQNDDPLYLPLIKRVRSILGEKTGLLYCGDCKMSSFSVRGNLDAFSDYYLAPLQKNNPKISQEIDKWIHNGISCCDDTPAMSTLVWRKNQIIGGGYEIKRFQRSFLESGKSHSWNERVLIFRSLNLSKVQNDGLEKRLRKAELNLEKLKEKSFKTPQELSDKISCITERYKVSTLLDCEQIETKTSKNTYQRSEIRNGKKRNGTYTVCKSKYVLLQVKRHLAEIEEVKRTNGWRIYATNIPETLMSLEQLICYYREEWVIEKQFHILKDKPIGIRPLFVKTDIQISGMARFLTVALRLWSYITLTVHNYLVKQPEIQGLYKGQPKKKTKRPSAKMIMESFSKICLFYNEENIPRWRLTPIDGLAGLFLKALELPLETYELIEMALEACES
ncbi:MAG: transposase [Parachlamydiaceae bacterium]|nr:transposase [Parachlamydiaceae bacterium]